ncbi:MAG: nickel-dependent lactate racemase [Candidatus Baldrarchaeota archaeon]
MVFFNKLDINWIKREAKILDILLPAKFKSKDEWKWKGIAEMDLKSVVTPGNKVAIAVPDVTRPVPTWEILPCLVKKLRRLGVSPGDITVIFATGTHKETDEMYIKKVFSKLAIKPKYIIHNDEDGKHVYLGDTRYGTPVEIDASFLEADIRITVGGVQPHPWAGFSGGAKMVLPGLSSTRTVSTHHVKWVGKPGVKPGNLEDNPFREDLEEAGKMAEVTCSLEIVLDENYNIVYSAGGPMDKAFRNGVKISSKIYLRSIRKLYDLVIANAAPQDVNFYQATKALQHAFNAVKPGGTLILFTESRLGAGTPAFKEFMNMSREDVLETITSGKVANLVPALVRFDVDKVLDQVNLYIATLNKRLMREIPWFNYLTNITAVKKVIGDAKPENVAVMPRAAITVPKLYR